VRPATGAPSLCSRLCPTVVPLATAAPPPSTYTSCRSTRCPIATCSWILTTLNFLAAADAGRRSSIQYPPPSSASAAAGAQYVSSRPSSTHQRVPVPRRRHRRRARPHAAVAVPAAPRPPLRPSTAA
ncbi:hypothetical protein EE612_049008, partial [Oryza sativa]